MATPLSLSSVENASQEAMLKELLATNDAEQVTEICKRLIANAKADLVSSNSLHLYEAANYIHSAPEFREITEELFKLVLNFNDLYGCGAINSYCWSWLIPEGRFEEAIELLGHSISLDVGEESINSLSNYAQVLVKQGMVQQAEIIFAWIRCSDSPLLRPEANYHLAHLGRNCKSSEISKELLREVVESADSSYVQLAKNCSTGRCDYSDSVEFQIDQPGFLTAKSDSVSQAFPSFTTEIPFELPGDIEHGWKSKSFYEKLTASESNDFAALLPYFIAALDSSDQVVREILNRHIPKAVTTSDWITALYLLLRFGLENKTAALAIDAGRTLIQELGTSSKPEARKIVAVAQAALLEIYVRTNRTSESEALAKSVNSNDSAEWSYSLALKSIAQGNAAQALQELALGVDLGHFRSKVTLFAIELTDNNGYTAQADAIKAVDQERREYGEPSHTGLPAEARQFWSDVERVLDGTSDGEILIGTDVLVCSLVSVFMKLPALATEVVIRSEKFVPDRQVEDFSFGVVALLDQIHDITLARSDLGRFPHIVDIMEKVGFVEVVIALSRNPHLKPTFSPENAPLAAAARGLADDDTLIDLIESEIPAVLFMLAELENLSPKVFAKLAESKNQEVLDKICSRPDAPNDVLETLIEKASSQSLWKMASAENASPQILKLLAVNKADSVRRAVAANTSTPTEILETLALDPAWPVREKVISNTSASDNAKALAALQG